MATLGVILEQRLQAGQGSNKAGAGVDGMTVDVQRDCLCTHVVEIVQIVKAEKYKPQSVRRVMIPKEEKVSSGHWEL